MFKRLYIKRIIKLVSFICGFVLIYHLILPVFASASIMHNGIAYEYRNFGKNTFDVVLVGASDIGWAIHPLQLYGDQGISAFSLYSAGQRIPQSYYAVKQALREQNPELVVLDVLEIGRDDLGDHEGVTHWMVDSLSLPERIEYIMDLIPRENRWNYFFAFNTYHSRWDKLSEQDFCEPLNRTGTYGAWIWYGAYPFENFGPIIQDKTPLPKTNEKYLRKTIELCQKNNVDILLTLMPMDYNAIIDKGKINRTEQQKYWNEIQDIADEYGINYLNFMYHYDELRLDPANSMDGGTHLNTDSAEKVTGYVGKYIKENYDIPDVRENPDYDFMREDFEKFEVLKTDFKLKSITDFSGYLDWLKKYKSPQYTILMSVKDIQGYSLTPEITDKLIDLGYSGGGILLEKTYHSFIGIINGDDVTEIYGDDEALSYEDEINGRKLYMSSKTLNMGNQAEIKIGDKDYSKNVRGINIVVYDNQKEEIIDSVSFDTHVPEFTCNR